MRCAKTSITAVAVIGLLLAMGTPASASNYQPERGTFTLNENNDGTMSGGACTELGHGAPASATMPQGQTYGPVGGAQLLPPGTQYTNQSDPTQWVFVTQDGTGILDGPTNTWTQGTNLQPPAGYGNALTTTSYKVVQTTGGIYQPETGIVCSGTAPMHYIWQEWVNTGTATASCPDAYPVGPSNPGFVQYVQNLAQDTPLTLQGVSDQFSQSEANWAFLEGILGESAEKGAGYALSKYLGGMFSPNPWKYTWSGMALSILEDGVSSYLDNEAIQMMILDNVSFDYMTDGDQSAQVYSPANSSLTDGTEISIGIAGSPFADWAAVSLTCVSSPAVQGQVPNQSALANQNSFSSVGDSFYNLASSSGAASASATKTRAAKGSGIVGQRLQQNKLNGTSKNDSLHGGYRKDVIKGGKGNDKIESGDSWHDGKRNIAGDVLRGGPGKDVIHDFAGSKDRIFGGTGDDVIIVRDQAGHGKQKGDVIKCGKGNDVVFADRTDRIAKDCEHVFFTLKQAEKALPAKFANSKNKIEKLRKQPANWPRRR